MEATSRIQDITTTAPSSTSNLCVKYLSLKAIILHIIWSRWEEKKIKTPLIYFIGALSQAVLTTEYNRNH